MSSRSWIRNLFARKPVRPVVTRRPRLAVEALEDRAVPAVFAVTSALDDGTAGTLRWAVEQANTTAGADTITFADGVAGGTITLDATRGQLTLTDSAITTIDGGTAGVTIDGNDATRLFVVGNQFLGQFASAAFNRLTLTGGNVIGFGGGIYNDGGSTLTITDSTILGNTAHNNSGGGIANFGSLTVVSSTLAGNTATSGGGIYNASSGAVTITDSTVSGNSVGFIGGGIANNGSLTMSTSTLSSNTAEDFGGGIANFGTLGVSSSTLSNNTGRSGTEGIFNFFATATLTRTILADRVGGTLDPASANNLLVGSGSVGGLSHGVNGNIVVGTVAEVGLDPAGLRDNGGPTQTIALVAGSVAVNRGTNAGGLTDQRGVTRDARPDIGAFEFTDFQPSLVVTTLADEDDGTTDSRFGTGTSLREAIAYANANAGADTITFADNVAGGTIVLGLGQLTLTDSATTTIDAGAAGVTLDGNDATRVLQVNGGAEAALNRVTITRGFLVGDVVFGAGVRNFGSLTLTASAVANNRIGLSSDPDVFSSDSFGGGIANHAGATLTLVESAVSGNRVQNRTSHGGGGIYNDGGTVTLTASTVADNSVVNDAGFSAGQGGGIFNVGGGMVTVTASTMSGNSARIGGGIYNVGGGTVTVTDSTLSGNTATSGGGIYNGGGTVTVTASTLSGNSAVSNGGGIYNGGTVTVTGSTLSGNSVSSGSGGGMENRGTATVTASTIAGNTASFGGGILIGGGGTATVTASTIAGNTASFGGGIWIGGGGAATVTASTIAGNSAGTGSGISSSGTATLVSTIVAGEVSGTLAPASTNNLIVGSAAEAGLEVDANVNPVLKDNGGPTQTIALLPGSPAIGAGLAGATTADQRGLARNASPDIGAFETQVPTVTVTAAGGTYNGSAYGATGAAVTGLNGAALAAFGSPALSYTYYAGTLTAAQVAAATPLPSAPTNAGSYTVVATFTSTAAGYRNATSGPATFTIGQATPTVALTVPQNAVYSGAAFTATATVAGVVAGVDDAPAAALQGVGPTVTYYAGTLTLAQTATATALGSAPVNFGAYTAVARFAGSADYAAAAAAQTFTIRPSSNSALAGLTPSSGSLSPAFSPGVRTYTTSVSNVVSALTVTPVAADGTATIRVNGVAATSGTASNPVVLTVGTTTAVSVVVTAQDGVTTSVYTVNVFRAALPTITITSGDVTYDGSAYVPAATLTGLGGVPGSTLGGVGLTFSYADSAGNSISAPTAAGTYTVFASYAGSVGYDPLTVGKTFAITPRVLTVTAAASDRVYDGTTAAAVSLTLGNAVTGETPTATFTSATFGDKNVGTGKTVTISGIALTPAFAANYTLNGVTAVTATATISPKAITGAFTAADRVYDGTTAATVTTRTLSGVVGGDAVSLAGGAASFADKNAGASRPVTLTGAALTGADAGNYTLTGVAATTANIAKRALAVSATGVNKVFDGTTAATVTLSDDRLNGDALNLTYGSAAFADPNPGINKPVSVTGINVSGADAGNYTFNTTAATTATITPASVSVGLTTDRPVAVPGLAVTFTATVTAAGGFPVTGTVTFRDEATVLGTVPVVNGVARLTIDALQYGNKTITATFAGAFAGPTTPPSVGVSVVPAAILFDPGTGQNALFVGGTAGNDEIQVKGKGNNRYEVEIESGCWEFEQEFTGAIGRIVVYAGAGNDVVDIDGNVRVPVYQFGGAGDDELRGADNAPNVLVGGTGNDTLKAGSARDILIGGAGADRLFGKGGDDLMIAGSTAFDVNESALWGIQLEWTSDRSFATRVANLRGTGTGPRATGTAFLVASGPNRTVFDDGSADYLKGGSGRDWYFANVSGGGVLDAIAGLSGDDLIDDLS